MRHRETRTHPPKKPMRVVTSGSPTKTAFHTTAQLEVECLGSSLRIEFLLNQNQGQIGPLCLEKRGDRIQNRAAVASLCDSPASTIPFRPRSVRVSLSKNTTPLRLNPMIGDSQALFYQTASACYENCTVAHCAIFDVGNFCGSVEQFLC